MTSQRRQGLQYIVDMQPDLIDTSAAEFARLARTAGRRQSDGQRFHDTIQWDGAGRDTYTSDLTTAVADLGVTGQCFADTGTAVRAYSGQIRTAQHQLSTGAAAEANLRIDCQLLFDQIGDPSADVEDPLQTWQLNRKDVTNQWIKQDGDYWYQAATNAYNQSEATANQARDTAVSAIQAARNALPTISAGTADFSTYTLIQHAAGFQSGYETEMTTLHPDWAKAFHQMFGRDPVSDGDWQLAQNATAEQGFPIYDKVGKQALISGFRFKPAPGRHGVVKVNIFIGARQAGVAGDDDRGDDRGFDANAGPDDNRATMYLDMDTGLAVVRQNPTLDAGQTQGFEQDHPVADNYQVAQAPNGTLAIHYAFQNPHHHPGWSPVNTNPTINGTMLLSPQPNGAVQVSGDAVGFPSYEVTQTVDGEPTDLVQLREHQVTDLFGLPGQARHDYGPDSATAADLNNGDYDWNNPANRPDPNHDVGGMPSRYPPPTID